MTIKTNKKARGFYLKHLSKLDDYANGNFEDDNCYMCEAANAYSTSRHMALNCEFCPLDDYPACCTSQRKINLVHILPTASYHIATPESIRAHIKWIEKQINDKTDCLIYYE